MSPPPSRAPRLGISPRRSQAQPTAKGISDMDTREATEEGTRRRANSSRAYPPTVGIAPM